MPTADEILKGLTLIANEGKSVALVWHVLIAVTLGALALGWRPHQRTVSTLAVLPVASAFGAAFLFRNPFNTALLGLSTVALLVLARGSEPKAVARRPVGTQADGLVAIAFGWVYPHFLVDEPRAAIWSQRRSDYSLVRRLRSPSASCCGRAHSERAPTESRWRCSRCSMGSSAYCTSALLLDGGLIVAGRALASSAFADVGSKRASSTPY